MNNSGWNMYVFRDGKRIVSGSELISGLARALRRWSCAPQLEIEDSALGALIAAGELECALSDGASGSPSSPDARCHPDPSCSIASEITEALARAYLTGQRHSLLSILEKAEHIRIEASYEVAVQEGFAYYALHPRKIAMVLDHIRPQHQMAVIGIRSIGVTLSAVACIALQLRGVQCRRITVRPIGHPYDRSLEITPELSQWVEHSRDAGFLVTDEGPGISGSSFLAVAEALVQCGVAARQIHLIGNRAVNPATLRAPDAAKRWTRYNVHVMQSAPLPPSGAGRGLSGGLWRRHFPCGDGYGPASWAPLEPAKFLSCDELSIFKFEGFGHYGEAIGARAKLLAEHGFSPRYLGNHCGFGQYALLAGRLANPHDLSPELLERMAGYIALRSVAFACESPQTSELEKMLRWNWQNEFGEELTEEDAELRTERTAVCDGRMMPHEWFRTDRGELLKLDAVSHGDNHFFPGPCDIAWDVAGAIVEWEMRGEVRNRFVREYETRSGDAITPRLEPYLLAYTIFCLGWSKMAALAMQGEYDEALLKRDYLRYRVFASHLRREHSHTEVPLQKSTGDDPCLRAA